MSLQQDGRAGSPGPATMLARAKVNYALHVTGRREDGYHLLESLVVFPEFGDRLSLVDGDAPGRDGKADLPRLALSGPFAAALEGEDPAGNLVLRAADAFTQAAGHPSVTAPAFHLEKRLPVASGIGGGSADAAAALRLLETAFPGRVDAATLSAIAARLGADVPMCLAGQAACVSGIGDRVAPLASLPAHGLVLVNPGLPVATPSVFKALARCDNAPMPGVPAQGFASLAALLDWLGATRNDLEAPALSLCPQIGDVLSALGEDGATRLARMSGSGATCFAITDDAEAATALARRLAGRHPGWWIAAAAVAALGSGTSSGPD